MVHGRKESFKGQLILVLGVALFGLILGYSLQIPLRVLGCFLPFPIGVVVDVTNKGSAPVSNLRISFTGGEDTWAKLDQGVLIRSESSPPEIQALSSVLCTPGEMSIVKRSMYILRKTIMEPLI